MIKCIAFDLDDTLYPEHQYVLSGLETVAEYISGKYKLNNTKTYSRLVSLYEVSTLHVFDRFYNDSGINLRQGELDTLISMYRNHSPKIDFYSDVIEFLIWLRDEGIKTAIITDGNLIQQRKKINTLNANKYFEYIVINDEFGKSFWKPNPFSYKLVSDKFQIEFYEMIYVGDNKCKDFHIKHIHPVITVYINRNGLYENAMCDNIVEADYTVNSLHELKNTILNGGI